MKSLLFLLSLALAGSAVAAPPVVGQTAPNFTLSALDGRPTQLSAVLAQGPVALIVLRGFPGYQCPLCNRQVQDLVQNAEGFAKAGLRVVLVYPGPAAEVTKRAEEFASDKKLPAHFTMVLDPDYAFTKQYDLRWEAKNETAYPSAFLLDRTGKITFAKVSNSHGGRASAKELLTAAGPQ
jgi:peroxiredoxin Q/BCP